MTSANVYIFLKRSIHQLAFYFYIHGFSNCLAVSDCFQFWKSSLLLVRMKLTALMMDSIGNSPVLRIENSIARIRLLNFRYAFRIGRVRKVVPDDIFPKGLH